jgi:uncharacterized protein YdcH (DUF465 family)
MTAWDVLNTVMKAFPPFVAALLFVAAGIVFIVGFGRHGTNFLRYGFKQVAVDNSFEKRFDQLEKCFGQFEKRFDQMETNLDARFAKIDGRFAQIDDRFEQIDVRFKQIEGKIETIESNHFGHLKNYLGLLNGILLDHELVDNTMKARLDNELRGM